MSIVPPKAKPDVGESSKRAGYLLAGLSTLTALFTALGLKSDELPDLWRNHAALSYVAITLILVGVALGAAAGWLLKNGGKWERRSLLVGNTALGLGLIVVAWGVIANASDQPKPTVTALIEQADGNTTVKARIEDTKLKSSEALDVKVEPLYEVTEPNGELAYRVGRPLYSATFGPNSDGSVKRSINAEIPPGTFEDVGVRASTNASIGCYKKVAATGCVVVRMPQRSNQPEFSLTWKRGPKKHGISLHVGLVAFDVPGGTLHFLARSMAPAHLLARANVAVNLADDINRTFAIPMSDTKVVCVAAASKQEPLECPPKDRNQPGWAMLRVPLRR